MAQVNSIAGRLKSERGAELIEFALVFPLLLLVLVGMIDFGFLFQRYEVLTNAAREGARIAVLPNYTAGDAQSRVCTYLTTSGVPATNCPAAPTLVTVTNDTVTVPTGPPINARRVTIAYTHNFMFIGPIINMFGGTWNDVKTITINAVMRVEL